MKENASSSANAWVSIKIPFALLTSEKAADDLFYLQPRYSQRITQPSGSSSSIIA
jgi:hypothetical protein